MVIGGPSSSGKSTLVAKIIQHAEELFHPPPRDILYAYGQYGEHITEMAGRGVKTYSGVPPDNVLDTCDRPLLLILDDLMMDVSPAYLTELFTKRNHHESIFTIFLVQNIFDKNINVARANSQYIILTRAPNALGKVKTLGGQHFPVAYFMDAYTQATAQPYGYLLLDMHATTKPRLHLRSHIFPNELSQVFVPKNAV